MLPLVCAYSFHCSLCCGQTTCGGDALYPRRFYLAHFQLLHICCPGSLLAVCWTGYVANQPESRWLNRHIFYNIKCYCFVKLSLGHQSWSRTIKVQPRLLGWSNLNDFRWTEPLSQNTGCILKTSYYTEKKKYRQLNQWGRSFNTIKSYSIFEKFNNNIHVHFHLYSMKLKGNAEKYNHHQTVYRQYINCRVLFLYVWETNPELTTWSDSVIIKLWRIWEDVGFGFWFCPQVGNSKPQIVMILSLQILMWNYCHLIEPNLVCSFQEAKNKKTCTAQSCAALLS